MVLDLDIEVSRIVKNLPMQTGDMIYVGGSFTAGFYNRSSDVDVFLIHTDDRPVTCQGHQLFIDHRRVDIQNIRYSDWVQLSERIHRSIQEDPYTVSLKDIMLYYRTSVGYPLHQQEQFYSARNRLFDPCVLSSLLKTRYEIEIEKLVTDVQIALELGWQDVLVESLEKLIHTQMALHCAVRGENYPNHKWRYEKLYKLYGHEHPVPLQFRNFEGQIAFVNTREQVEELLERVLERSLNQWNVDQLGIRVRVVPNVDAYQIGQESYLINGIHAYAVSEEVFTFFRNIQKCTEGTVLPVGKARSIATLLRDFETKELLSVQAELVTQLYDGDDNVEFPNNEVRYSMKQEVVAELVDRRIRGWMAWIDYQSFYDDYQGAVGAEQWEAALIAVRKMVIETLKLRLAEMTGQFPKSHHFLHQVGLIDQDSAREAQNCLFQMPENNQHLRDVIESSYQFCLKCLADPVPQLVGNIREEIPHQMLFDYGAAWLSLARKNGVPIPLSEEMIRKTDELTTTKEQQKEQSTC